MILIATCTKTIFHSFLLMTHRQSLTTQSCVQPKTNEKMNMHHKLNNQPACIKKLHEFTQSSQQSKQKRRPNKTCKAEHICTSKKGIITDYAMLIFLHVFLRTIFVFLNNIRV